MNNSQYLGRNRFTGKPTNPSNFYVNPDQLSAAFVESQSLSCMTDELGEMIIKITDRVKNFPKFKYLPQDTKDDCASYSYERLAKRLILVADPTNPRLFSYITTAVSLNMQSRLGQIQKQEQKNRKLKEQLYLQLGREYINYVEECCEDLDNR